MAFLTDCPLALESAAARDGGGMEVDDVEESGRRREFPNRWSISVRLDPGPTGHMADKPKF